MSKKVVFITKGTRGDVQPLVLLSKYLKQLPNSEWKPMIMGLQNFSDYVTQNGIDFRALSIEDADKQMFSKDIADSVSRGEVMKFVKMSMSESNPEYMNNAIQEEVKNAALVVCNPLTFHPAADFCEVQGIPCVFWQTYPMTKTSTHPEITLGFPDMKWFNSWTHDAFNWLIWVGAGKDINKLRSSLSLSTFRNSSENRTWYSNLPSMCTFSPFLVPTPSDYPEHIKVTGFIADEAKNVELDTELANFISKEKDQSPVVYIGFGSMPVSSSERFPKLLNEIADCVAESQEKIRFVVFIGKLTPTASEGVTVSLPENFFGVVKTSHASLFPKCDFIVHHCGAGTTCAALRSGVPSWGVYVFGDQPFWSKRTATVLGTDAPLPLAFPKLTAKKFMAAFKKSQLQSVKDNAAMVAEKLKEEDALATIATYFDQLIAPVVKVEQQVEIGR